MKWRWLKRYRIGTRTDFTWFEVKWYLLKMWFMENF